MPNSSLVNFFVGKNDSLDEVLSNKKLENFTLVKMEQIHGSDFFEINDDFFVTKKSNLDPYASIILDKKSKQITIPKVDAIISTKKNVLLSIKTADCLPITIHWQNQKDEFVAAIHAGRVGTEKQILKKVLQHLKNKYHMNPHASELEIWFGPAICKDCYQIDRATNLHYDLFQENIKQLEELFPINNIKFHKSDRCTLYHNDQLHSYRKTGNGVKMNYSLIGF